MRKEKLGFGVIVRVFISLFPLLFGASTLAVISCAYNITMSFIIFGPLNAFVSSLCSVCIAMLIGSTYGSSGELSGLVISIQAVLAAFGCIYGYLCKKKFSYGLSLCTAGILIPQFLYVKHIAATAGMSVSQAIVPSTNDMASMLSSSFSEMQLTFTAAEINEIALLVNKISVLLVPSIFIFASMVLAYVVMWCVSAQLRKLPLGIKHSFAEIRISAITAIITVFLFVILLICIYIPVNEQFLSEEVFTVIANMAVVLLTICLFTGISLADFFLRKKIKFTFFRLILYAVSIIIIPVSFIAYIVMAIVDSFVDFRRISEPIPVEKGELNETEK